MPVVGLGPSERIARSRSDRTASPRARPASEAASVSSSPDGHGPRESGPSAIDIREGLAAAVFDASGAICGALSALFAFFIVFNDLDLPPRVAAPVVAYDVVLVVVFGVGWRTLPGRRIPPA